MTDKRRFVVIRARNKAGHVVGAEITCDAAQESRAIRRLYLDHPGCRLDHSVHFGRAAVDAALDDEFCDVIREDAWQPVPAALAMLFIAAVVGIAALAYYL